MRRWYRDRVWIADKPTLHKNVIARTVYGETEWIRLLSSLLEEIPRHSRRQLSGCLSTRAKVSNNITAADEQVRGRDRISSRLRSCSTALLSSEKEIRCPNCISQRWLRPVSSSRRSYVSAREEIRKTFNPRFSHLVPASARLRSRARPRPSRAFPEKFRIEARRPEVNYRERRSRLVTPRENHTSVFAKCICDASFLDGCVNAFREKPGRKHKFNRNRLFTENHVSRR